VGIAAAQAVGQPVPLLVAQVLRAGAQDVADTVEGVVLVSEVAQGVLLNAATDLVQHLPGELDDVERVQDRGGLAQLVAQRVRVAAERIQGGDLHAVAKAPRALLEPGREHRARAAWDQVQQSGVHGPVGVAGQVDHPVSIVGPLAAALCGVWCHTCSSTPREATPDRRDSSSASSTSRGATAHHSVFHDVANCRDRPSMVACSWRSWPIAQVTAR